MRGLSLYMPVLRKADGDNEVLVWGSRPGGWPLCSQTAQTYTSTNMCLVKVWKGEEKSCRNLMNVA